ncbi:siderophore-interacting protein [Georgenia sp. Z1344]|uniref:siderophore-interacting protein n=1 Tax=Georgenia sp. Z1344 TaxID=3416706 RepID=UPI003CF4FA14
MTPTATITPARAGAVTYPPSRAFRTRVRAVEPLTPHLTRITLTGDELEHAGPLCLDQRIKLYLPRADGTLPDVGLFDEPRPTMAEWYRRWRELPDAERNPMRTYTLRAVRPGSSEIDIDFVLHGTEGPASAWASAAQVGDELVVIGPDARSESENGGIAWHPGRARRVLLAGDETALPAICGVVETLDASFSGEVFVEVPTAEDVVELAAPDGMTVHWLVRGEREHGAALDTAVRAWGDERFPAGGPVADGAARAGTGPAPQTGPGDDAPSAPTPDPEGILWDVPADVEGPDYAWLAGEASVITALRRFLVRDKGLDRRSVAFMGYWRRGRSEGS